MKILQLVTAPVLGGAQDVLFQLARDQKSRGLEVLAATSPGGPLPARLGQLGIPVVEIPMERGLQLSSILRLRRFVRARGIRLLHAHGARATLYAYLATRGLRGLRLVSHVHLFDDWRFDGSVRARVDRFVSRRFDRVIACSQFLRQALVRRQGFLDSRTIAIPNGIEVQRFGEGARAVRLLARLDRQRPGQNPPDRASGPGIVVGVCARLEPQKGLAYLIDAVGLLAGRHPGLVLEIAGDGSLREELQQRARDAGLGDRVRWLGHRKDIPRVLAGFDLFVLPSLAEGLPLSVLEAMAAEVPVIATAVSGTPEVVQPGETGLLVPPGSARALAEAVTEAVEHPAETRQRAQAARALVSGLYSVEAMTESVRRLYAELDAGV